MRQKILVAENERETLELVGFSLSAEGYDILIAATGLEALKQARAVLPDLIILDSMLPDIDGATVCDILRRLPSTAPTPILLLTAPTEARLPCVGMDRAADKYLGKPFTPTELALTVNEMLLRFEEYNVEKRNDWVMLLP